MKNQEIQKPDSNKREPQKQEPQRQEFQRRNPNNSNNHNQGPRNTRESSPNRDKEAPPVQNRDNSQTRDNTQNRSFQRENPPRQNYAYQNSQSKFNSRVKAIETVEDIKADIVRIEKEIDLEIKEIKTMRLGL